MLKTQGIYFSKQRVQYGVVLLIKLFLIKLLFSKYLSEQHSHYKILYRIHQFNGLWSTVIKHDLPVPSVRVCMRCYRSCWIVTRSLRADSCACLRESAKSWTSWRRHCICSTLSWCTATSRLNCWPTCSSSPTPRSSTRSWREVSTHTHTVLLRTRRNLMRNRTQK